MSDYFTIVQYIASASYFLGTLLYLKHIPELILNNNNEKLFGYILLIISFSILTYFTYQHAIHDQDKEKESEYNIIGKPSNYAYGLLALYFMLGLLFDYGLYFRWTYLFPLLGYTLLAIEEVSGIFLVAIFYLISILTTFYFKRLDLSSEDILLIINKAGLLVYFTVYAVNYTLRTYKNAFKNLLL